jgi:hypothetical protein
LLLQKVGRFLQGRKERKGKNRERKVRGSEKIRGCG